MFTGPQIVTNGLILYLDAGNSKSYPTTGTTWYDRSGNGNTGTLTNGPTFDSSNNGSIVFDGVDDFLNISDNVELRLNGNFTITLWHKAITKTATYPGPLYKGNSGLTGFGYILFYVSIINGAMIFKRNNQSFTLPGAVNTYWSYITFTYDGSNIRGYVNGIISYTSGIVTFLINTDTSTLKLGKGDEYSNSAISNIGIYNRALTSQEVLQNYNATKSRYGL